ncbi:MAG: hypothetical protein JSU00_06995 [Acidobacteria bacterium]|nr:hypothetical protein [Acidobacteriota bacterium]
MPKPLLVVLIAISGMAAQTAEEYKVYTEQPRLLLRPQRLRLLKRERDRQSMRWEQFNVLMSGKAQMPEPGFALALHYAVTGEADSARQAIAWAGSATDLRQIALVFDWCRPAMSAAETRAVSARLIRGAAALAARTDLLSLRDRTLAAIATADIDPAATEAALRDVIQNGWRKGAAPRLREGSDLPPGDALFALFEMLHVIQDNLTIDLREDARDWFRELPALHLLSHYPSAYPSPENEYWIPAFDADKAPDLRIAALSRAAEMEMVAFDNNAVNNQFLQGWLMQDRFLLRSAFGIVYEFLWANPYQPGLSYSHFPLAHHDPKTGGLFIRSSWDGDALWFGRVGKEWQMFQDGKITSLNTRKSREPILLGDTAVCFAKQPVQFELKSVSRVYILGLAPKTLYDVEVDDEEMHEETSDAAGTIEIVFPEGASSGIRIHPPAAATN